jgi:hypothetical protein
MTTLLQQAFAEAAKLSPAEQDVLAARLLAELAAEHEFDCAIASSAGTLAALAREALAEHRVGQVEELNRETWTVHRQDDNGNRFVVHTGLSREAAERLVAEMEARGHKQVFWAEQER